ncbi:AF4/FMR2 family member 1 isoform X2 [Denticeps clupeoides]|uniref:AF4/FMR2 family member 1 isoform X2 n=1 Tax=Denticeps clupeoides TaxID=299321 RepID=UPI0010A3124B|nr:AF4/FMR2 family member 1 isoform X2 [Denticeps clupeoides]
MKRGTSYGAGNGSGETRRHIRSASCTQRTRRFLGPLTRSTKAMSSPIALDRCWVIMKTEPSDSDHHDTDDKDSPERCSLTHEPRGSSRMDVSHMDSQKESNSQGSEATCLPSQTFSLPSKLNLVMPQKPTAYVRPLDGPDQVTSESPDLKPSPDFCGQSYENLPELKSTTKPSLSQLKIPQQSLETLSNEVQCVEEILREMTRFCPPLLTAINTPSTAEPPKFNFPVKEPQHVHTGFSIPKYCSPKSPLASCPQELSVAPDCSTAQPAHSSGGETASSSESESSSDSDSESSESGGEEREGVAPPARSSLPPAKNEGPADIDWQLGRWLKEPQPSLNVETQSEVLHNLNPASKPQEEVITPSNYYSSHTPHVRPVPSDAEVKSRSTSQHCGLKSPKPVENLSRKNIGNKQPSKTSKATRQENCHAGLQVESVEVAQQDKEIAFKDPPKVKTKADHRTSANKVSNEKPTKRNLSDKKKTKEIVPKTTALFKDGDNPAPSSPVQVPPPRAKTSSVHASSHPKLSKKHGGHSPVREGKSGAPPKTQASSPHSLVVKINLSFLSRVPQQPSAPRTEKKVSHSDDISTKAGKKRPAEKSNKSVPRKRLKLDKESKPPPSLVSAQLDSTKPAVPKGSPEQKERRKKKKKKQEKEKGLPADTQAQATESVKGSKHKPSLGEPPGFRGPEEGGDSTLKHKKSSGKRSEQNKTGKKAPKGSFAVPESAQPSCAPAHHRALLRCDERQNSVEYHMNEAKKLKHKADAMSDKVSKAFKYLEAAMSFVESGIAMESDPHTPKSAYTMFSETVDLIRFILKLKNFLDPAAPATEREFAVLCMKCQSLLQMAMFRYKREAALKYSRTLTDHFKSSKSAQAPSPCISKSMGTPSPISPLPSPASSASSSQSSSHSLAGSASTTSIPQVIQQVASSYVNITTLFLNAHDTWEQAIELAQRGSGLLLAVDSTSGPLSLTSSVSTMARYTREGLHCLRLSTQQTH